MNEPFWIMQGYEIYIWPSYVLTLLSLGLTFLSFKQTISKSQKIT